MVSDELDAIGREDGAHQPLKEPDDRESRNKHHPEPEKRVDFLSVHVDRQHALDGVAMDVAQPSDLK